VKVVSVVGARPQFVKLAPVAQALDAAGHEHVIIHTGQHYDECMSGAFFTDLKIPDPDVNLGVGSGSHGVQTGAALAGLDPVLDRHRPDWVLVYGDTNSTLAGALAAAKLHLPLAHLEAGVRSGNRRMPEEHNRVLTDHAADLLLAPTAAAAANLAAEGLAGRAVMVGDVMTDVLLRVATEVESDDPLPFFGELTGGYVVATLHRPENTDNPIRLAAVVKALDRVEARVILVAHPRLLARAREYGIILQRPGITVMEALPYPQMVRLLLGCRAVVTDSGGLQKDAYLLGRPVTTVRSETEWPETLYADWNVLAANLTRLPSLALRPVPTEPRGEPFGDGHAATRVVEMLEVDQRGDVSDTF
jgi:UDP-N-acetylglucosamine 2-epimerase (non-hydrolysing)